MPIEYAPQFTKKYNPTLCEALGIEVPSDYEAIAQKKMITDNSASSIVAADNLIPAVKYAVLR